MLLKVSGARPHFRPVNTPLARSRVHTNKPSSRRTSPKCVGIGHSDYSNVNLSPTKTIEARKTSIYKHNKIFRENSQSPGSRSEKKNPYSKFMKNLIKFQEETAKLDPFMIAYSARQNYRAQKYEINITENLIANQSYFPTTEEEFSRTRHISTERNKGRKPFAWGTQNQTAYVDLNRTRNQLFKGKASPFATGEGSDASSAYLLTTGNVLRPDTSYSNRPTTAATGGLRVSTSFEGGSQHTSRATTPWNKFEMRKKTQHEIERKEVNSSLAYLRPIQDLDTVDEGNYQEGSKRRLNSKRRMSESSIRTELTQRTSISTYRRQIDTSMLQMPQLDEFNKAILKIIAQKAKEMRGPKRRSPKRKEELHVISEQQRPKSSMLVYKKKRTVQGQDSLKEALQTSQSFLQADEK